MYESIIPNIVRGGRIINMIEWIVAFGMFMFGAGVLLGWVLFGDHMAERGKFVHGNIEQGGHRKSGWLHGGTLHVPVPACPGPGCRYDEGFCEVHGTYSWMDDPKYIDF